MKKSLTTYVIVGLTGLITLASSILTNLLTPIFEKQKYAMPMLITLAFASIVLIIIKWRQRLEVDIDVDPIRDDTAAQQHAQRGLIVFLSLYQHLAKKLTVEQIRQAALNLDYQTLELANTANTNLGHPITAIKSHRTKLEHCWVVCTRATGEGKNQSLDYAPVFVEYITREILPQMHMHYGEAYSVELDDDAIVCRNTYRLIKKIYQEAKTLGLKKTRSSPTSPAASEP